MKKILLALLLLAPLAVHAGDGSVGQKQLCVAAVDTTGSSTLVDSNMSASRTFTLWKSEASSGFDLLVFKIKLVDANTSITRFDLVCTAGSPGVTAPLDTTAYVPQECTVAAGVATCVDSATWQKASPGTKNWMYRLNMSGFSYATCIASVGTGSGAAADTIAITGRWCTE